jgi:hypothetical protein
MTRAARHAILVPGFLFLSFWMVGCGSRWATVSGVVTYNGKPVGKGNAVTVYDLETGSRPQLGLTGSDGRYAVRNVTPGKSRLVASCPRPIIPNSDPDPDEQSKLEFPDVAEGNGLIVELKPGANVVDVTLKSPASSK